MCVCAGVPGEDRGEAGVFKAQVKIAAFFLNVSRRAFLEYYNRKQNT